MDEDGYITKEDAALVAMALTAHDTITFSFSYGNGGADQIWMGSPPWVLAGVQHMGAGQGAIVGIYGRGTYVFQLGSRHKTLYPEYVSEKLRLPEREAEVLAELLNEVARVLPEHSDATIGSLVSAQMQAQVLAGLISDPADDE